MTEKQKDLIKDMNEFCCEKCSLEATKEEASRYIDKHIEEFKLTTMSAWQLNHM